MGAGRYMSRAGKHCYWVEATYKKLEHNDRTARREWRIKTYSQHNWADNESMAASNVTKLLMEHFSGQVQAISVREKSKNGMLLLIAGNDEVSRKREEKIQENRDKQKPVIEQLTGISKPASNGTPTMKTFIRPQTIWQPHIWGRIKHKCSGYYKPLKVGDFSK